MATGSYVQQAQYRDTSSERLGTSSNERQEGNQYERAKQPVDGLSREERYRLRYGTAVGNEQASESREIPPREFASGEHVDANTSAPSVVSRSEKNSLLSGVEAQSSGQPVAPGANSRSNASQAQNNAVETMDARTSNMSSNDPMSTFRKRLDVLKARLVDATKDWNIDQFEEIRARMNRTIEPYYASTLSVEVLLDQIESVVNEATLTN